MSRENPAPWTQWGHLDIDEGTLQQMENACRLPVVVRGALLPDAHIGYGLPIGGVIAAKNVVIPYAVGVDIACRMRLSVLDVPLSQLSVKREVFVHALEKETRFGIGAFFERQDRREHAVLDRDWNVSPVTQRLKDKAWSQLGTSGGGNHFVEFGEFHLPDPALGLERGVYLALLSHSGSRGAGEAVASYYNRMAMNLRPGLAEEVRHLAWLEMTSDPGREYWAAMQLMGFYAAANHELIHARVLAALDAQSIAFVENHHNFAWEEQYDGEALIVHRKGATPAQLGVLGIIPGSMGASGFIVRGKGNTQSLNSCSHGAGRIMSRKAAFGRLSHEEMHAYLQKNGVLLLSGGLDEAPMAYKDIHSVMAAQTELVETVARFEPRLVKMAPTEAKGRKKKKRSK